MTGFVARRFGIFKGTNLKLNKPIYLAKFLFLGFTSSEASMLSAKFDLKPLKS
jgi:hypothetical protein